jgi:hypothetical protein
MTTTTTPGGTTTTPTGAPLSIKLSSDNPASANVQKGSANNTVLKFTLTGGATATTVTGLTLKSYGTTEATGTTDVSAVKLYDENGIQIGNDRTPAGNQVNFVIVPALTIPANGTRTITVTANVGAATTNVMAAIRYGIESASGILGGTTFTGSYPVIGNSFTIVPAGQLGGVSVGKFGTLPKTTARVGEKDIVVERFNVSAGSNEDVAVNQITLTNAGSISDSDLTNIRLRQVGTTNTIAGPAVLSNKKVTFNLANPIALAKGVSINLEAVADIADGGTNGRDVQISIATGGVVARGATSGTNIVSTGSTAATTITLGNETLTVSMSSSHPQGAEGIIIKTTNKKDLAKFDIRANGGQIIINNVNVKLDGNYEDTSDAAGSVTAVGLYDGDSLVSDLQDMTLSSGVKSINFALNYTIAANTTKTLTVKGITNGLTLTGHTYISLATSLDNATNTIDPVSGYGLSSGASVVLAKAGSSVTTTAITIYPSGTVTPTADTTKTPYSQAVLVPSNNVTMAALKLYALREDMKLTDLKLTTAGTNNDAGDISSVTLYADDGVTALTNPVSNSALTYTFSTADFINDIVLTKGVYKTILVKANVADGLNGATDVLFKVVALNGSLKFVGQDSGTAYEAAPTGGSDVSFVITSPYAGGTFNGNKEVVTIAKSSTSPSGSVARGSQTVTGIWDVVNHSSTNASIALGDIKFTSKTGLPTGLVDDSDDELFTLYDGDGNVLHVLPSITDGNVEVDAALGTVAFADAADGILMTIGPGETKQLKLVVNTVNTAKFASNTQIQWSIEAVGDVNNAAGLDFVGYAGGTWTIPAVVNTVTLP